MIEEVAPLDAYVTAKPDEPVFTLQGGDPLAATLVRLWVGAARARAGLSKMWAPEVLLALHNVVAECSVADDEREVDSLKIRATAAEEVSWAMDEYRKGGHATDKPTEAEDTHLTELQRIELHDLRVRVAQKLSSFRCELLEMREALAKAGYADVDDGVGNVVAMSDFKTLAYNLKLLSEMIEPRRMMKD